MEDAVEIWLIGVGVLVVLWLFTTVMIVPQQQAAVTEVLGRFAAVKQAGLNFKWPYPISVERKMNRQRISLRLIELRETVSVKTRDNAFVSFPVAVQYRVRPDRVRQAFYELEDPEAQISSFVLNVVRTEAARLDLEDLYTNKQDIEAAVQAELQERMTGFGFEIANVLVDEPQPSKEVRDSFNRVIAAKREREAAENEAAAERIRLIGVAEAERESKRLQGEGIAAQRLAIAEGYNVAMKALKDAMPTTSEHDILAMLMMTNHWDTIRDAAHSPSNTILMNGAGEGALEDMGRLAAAFQAMVKNQGLSDTRPHRGVSRPSYPSDDSGV